jgi:hypothetical protein
VNSRTTSSSKSVSASGRYQQYFMLKIMKCKNF